MKLFTLSLIAIGDELIELLLIENAEKSLPVSYRYSEKARNQYTAYRKYVDNMKMKSEYNLQHYHLFNTVISNFARLPECTPEASILLLPTSGSTGFPKAALINSRGLVAQLPNEW